MLLVLSWQKLCLYCQDSMPMKGFKAYVRDGNDFLFDLHRSPLYAHLWSKVNSISSMWITSNNMGKELSECKGRNAGCSVTQGGLKSPPKPNELLKALTQRITSTIRSAKAREGSLKFLFFIQAWPCLQCLLLSFSFYCQSLSCQQNGYIWVFDFEHLQMMSKHHITEQKLNLLEYF